MIDTTDFLMMKDGRRLAFATYGLAGGRPMFFFHGLPGSRFQAALVHEQALAAGICLIAPDRPGFGLSSPAADRRILDWPRDVAALADRLGFRRFGVVGISCGGPYALACAQVLPERIDYVGLLAGIGPMDVPEIRRSQMPVLRLMFRLARFHPALAIPFLLADLMLFRRKPELATALLASLMTTPDRNLLASNPIVRRRFTASLAEAYRQGLGGPLRDVHLIATQHGIRFAEICQPVDVIQGSIDRNVPPEMGEHLASRLPNGRFHLYPDEGHLSIVVNRFGECLRLLSSSKTPHQRGIDRAPTAA